MWLLNLLVPNLTIHIIVGVSIFLILISFALKAIPVVGKYFEFVRVLAFVLLAYGSWHEGKIYMAKHYEEEMAQKIAQIEEKAKQENVKIEVQYVDRVKVVKQVEYKIKKEIQYIAPEIDKQCVIPPAVINILNQAATGPQK